MSRVGTHNALEPPEPGYFLMRLVRKGWSRVPARILFEDGLWQAEIDGSRGPKVQNPLNSSGVMRVWETARRVPQHEYDKAVEIKEWAKQNDPTHPALNPRQAIDLTEMNPLWRT